MPRKLDRALERIGGWVLPPRCVLCGGKGQPPCLDLCADCDAALPVARSRCARCGAGLVAQPGAAVCAACASDPPPYARCVAAFRYASPVDSLVQALKYRRQLTSSRVLGELLARALAADAGMVDAILPVPLHPLRHAERGFNQATEIARWVARRLDVRCGERLAARVREGPRQVGLPAAQRRSNLRGAFVADRDLVRGRRIAVLDDVLTTGSTATALTEALLDAGAARVVVWCVALAEGPRDRDVSEAHIAALAPRGER
jgi:ComF family protein